MSDKPSDPIDPASSEEAKAAAQLASQVDGLLTGTADRDAGSEAELLQLSSIIHASHHEHSLAEARTQSIIDEAMAVVREDAADATFATVLSLDQARKKRRRAWTGGLALGLAVAAAALFYLRTSPTQHVQESVATTTLPLHQQSRNSDELVGEISSEQSAMASSRIDQVYNNRLRGYRSLQYDQLVGKQ